MLVLVEESLSMMVDVIKISKDAKGVHCPYEFFHTNFVSSNASFSILNWNSLIACGAILVNSSQC